MTEAKLVIDRDTRLAVNPHLVLRIEDDDCALLFDPDSGSVQMLNETAVEVWQRLDGRRSLQDVLNGLHEVFDGMDETADRQVLELVNGLARIGAVGVWEQT